MLLGFRPPEVGSRLQRFIGAEDSPTKARVHGESTEDMGIRWADPSDVKGSVVCGYSLGYWTEEDEEEAEFALWGEYYKTGGKQAKTWIKA